MEEEFFSTIKLISGEEIVAKVSYVEEDECLFLFKPMKVESIRQKKHGQVGIFLKVLLVINLP